MDYKTLDSLNFGQTYFILFPYFNDSKCPILEQQPAVLYKDQFGKLELGCMDPLHNDRTLVLANDRIKLRPESSVNGHDVYSVEDFLKYYQKGSKGFGIVERALRSSQSF